jgi:uncharacterized protein YndB with AHSA1/START domain
VVDILHRVGTMTSTPRPVYEALTTVPGLAGWWTEQTAGEAASRGLVTFRFPPVGGFDMEVLEAVPDERVVWRVVDGPPEWVGTTIHWELSQDGPFTIVRFAHRGWAEPVEFMSHCSTKWATFLLSLKELVETGQGAPAPRDRQISNWH